VVSDGLRRVEFNLAIYVNILNHRTGSSQKPTWLSAFIDLLGAHFFRLLLCVCHLVGRFPSHFLVGILLIIYRFKLIGLLTQNNLITV
jgi:hypothetical protein